MALDKITTNIIEDDAVTATKIPSGAVGISELATATGVESTHHKIPTVTTANLPGAAGGTNASLTATNGMLVYNSTLGMLQQRSAGVWSGITTAPVITSFQYSDGASATAEKTVVGLVSVSCTTQTSTTVLVPGASLGIQVGQAVSGTGIPVGATVVSVIEDTSFVLSAAATASATVTLTFGGAVTITGTNFDSILAGGSANIGVTFDGTTATSISVNSLKTIITCTPPAHAAGTITMLLTNASGLTASTNFVYDVEPIFTTAAGSLGTFNNGAFTGTPDGTYPRIQGTESGVALTTGFQRVTSATDDTVITTALQGLTLQTTGYLTGTLAGTHATTYPFYATAMDNENQRTAPRLFNIIARTLVSASGGTVNTTISGYKLHLFTAASTSFVVSAGGDIDYLVIAGGGGAGKSNGGGGGAGGFRTGTAQAVTAQTYTITVGAKGLGSASGGSDGGNSSIGSLIVATGGGGGGSGSVAGRTGGSGGGGGNDSTVVGGDGVDSGSAGTFGTLTYQGHDGGRGQQASPYPGGGGGGAGGVGGDFVASTRGGTGGEAENNFMGLNDADSDAILTALSVGVDSGGLRYFAGGGGGASTGTSSTAQTNTGGAGYGAGSGGGVDATVNTGSGGGGGQSGNGGHGATGIVVIRYAV